MSEPTATRCAEFPGLVGSFFTLSGAGFGEPQRYSFIERREAAAAAGFSGIERYRRCVSTTRRRRPALIVLVIVAAAGCLALGWWLWQRFESASGTGQNLGYALQWPLFAGFVVYAYRKFVRYEEEPPQLHQPDEVTEIPAGLLPERPEPVTDDDAPDPALAVYNANLAELAEADEKNDRTHQ